MNGLMGFILLLFSAVAALSPQSAWYMSIGWKIKDAEPSDAALTMHRITGIIGVIVGFILIVSSCSSGIVNTKWEKQFQQKIEAGEVNKISFNRQSITVEEQDLIVEMIKGAPLIRSNRSMSYGSSGSGNITFQDGENVDLILFGPTGGIELHPNGEDHVYRIESRELETWISSNIIEKE
ncbi:DUF6199 family natural product biosynthesis protein [Paenibacillus paeoniae]|uniref:DUF6199 domain-containing protein n=1 Tax=Paenibacillus paeoniae TaxID=2292705 RepID=A0A371PHZ8_9BACL|nr:DUF6199 family natural product biosynthesis protein [Paenibacillus paeoniae]REK75000.1 hypothetical protein DX130_15290 [Paenibacillus paeoniae]